MHQARFIVAETSPRSSTHDPVEWRRLRQELRHAAQTGGFTLHFQPRQVLRTDAVVGADALLKWPRRRGGMTPAGGFMPLLESYGLAAGVGAWALTAACRAASLWPRGLVSIAADAASLRHGELLRQVGDALTESGLAAERLEIDLADSALAADAADTLFVLAALRDCGVGVALDGFGSETANLLPLKRLPLTVLKLDRSLVRDVPEDREACAVVQAAVDFAHALDVSVVACGVESAAQKDFLRRIGCDEGQGSLCGRGVPAEEIAAVLS